MIRTEKDVAWSVISQGYKCLRCGQPAIEVAPDDYQCINDPDCIIAMENERSEEAESAMWLSTADDDTESEMWI